MAHFIYWLRKEIKKTHGRTWTLNLSSSVQLKMKFMKIK